MKLALISAAAASLLLAGTAGAQPPAQPYDQHRTDPPRIDQQRVEEHAERRDMRHDERMMRHHHRHRVCFIRHHHRFCHWR